MVKETPRCASCLAGEIETEDVAGYFIGYIASESRPFRGYLCSDHVEMIASDNEAHGAKQLRRVFIK